MKTQVNEFTEVMLKAFGGLQWWRLLIEPQSLKEKMMKAVYKGVAKGSLVSDKLVFKSEGRYYEFSGCSQGRTKGDSAILCVNNRSVLAVSWVSA